MPGEDEVPVFVSGADVCSFVGAVIAFDTRCCCARLRNDGWCDLKNPCRFSLASDGPAVAVLASCSGSGPSAAPGRLLVEGGLLWALGESRME